MAKTCIRVEACNIGSSERHNLRSKELDYIRPELTHRNEQWVECSIAEVHRDITEKYKEATGQGLQKKATPIREGVIVISKEIKKKPISTDNGHSVIQVSVPFILVENITGT